MTEFLIAAAIGFFCYIVFFWHDPTPSRTRGFFFFPVMLSFTALLFYMLFKGEYDLTVADAVRGIFGSLFGFFLADWVGYLTRVSKLEDSQRRRHDRLGILTLVLLLTGTLVPEAAALFSNKLASRDITKLGLNVFGVVVNFEYGRAPRSVSPIVSPDLAAGDTELIVMRAEALAASGAAGRRQQRQSLVDAPGGSHLTPENAAKIIRSLPQAIGRHLEYFQELEWIQKDDWKHPKRKGPELTVNNERRQPVLSPEIEKSRSDLSDDIAGHHKLEALLAKQVFTPLAECAQFVIAELNDQEVLVEPMRPFIAVLRRYSRVYTDPNVVIEATHTSAYQAQLKLLERLASEGIYDVGLHCRLPRPTSFSDAQSRIGEGTDSVAIATSAVPSPYKTIALAYFLTMQGDWELGVWELEKWNRSPTAGKRNAPGYCPSEKRSSEEERICDWYDLTANAHIAVLANESADPLKVAEMYERHVDFFRDRLLKNLGLPYHESYKDIECAKIRNRRKAGPVIVDILWSVYIQDSNALAYYAARAGREKSFELAKKLSIRNKDIDLKCFLQGRSNTTVTGKELRDKINYFKALYADTYAYVLYRTARHSADWKLSSTEKTRKELMKVLKKAERTLVSAQKYIAAQYSLALDKLERNKELTLRENDVIVLYHKMIRPHTKEVERLIKAIDLGADRS